MKIDKYNTVVNSIEYDLDNILNFFDKRSTNANTASFNSKIKGFRANLRGVNDVNFFLFRLEKLFGYTVTPQKINLTPRSPATLGHKV